MQFYELTAWGPIAVTLLLLVVAVAIAVIVLPRRRRPGLRKHVEQAAALVLVSFLTVATLFLKLNADNVWYSSWTDLLGDSKPQAAHDTVGGPLVSGTPVPPVNGNFTALQRDPRSNPDFGSQLDPRAQDGQWLSVSLQGPTTGVTQKLLVWLPPSYLSQPDRAYPVITAFSGYPGSADAYVKTVLYDRIVTDRVSHGRLREPIVVIPDVYPSGLDTECVDGTGGAYESWVAVDVVAWISQNLRTVHDPQAWATTGYSAGGWCATMLSVRHPQQWARSINLAGYFAPQYSPDQQWTDPADPRYDLGAIVATQRPAVGVWFFTGGQDGDPKRHAEEFKKHIDAPTFMVSTVTAAGGHRMDVWVPAMGDSLDWLAATSPYFAAAR